MINNKLKACIDKSISLGNGRAIQNIKKCFKSMPYSAIVEMKKDVEMVNGNLFKGIINKVDLYEIDKYSFSLLEVMPGAKILYHVHNDCSEWYIVWHGDNIKPCYIGEGHEFKNETNKAVILLSIKLRK